MSVPISIADSNGTAFLQALNTAFDETIQHVGTIAALRTITPTSSSMIIAVTGYYTANDNIGVRDYYWDATSTETDNGGTIIQVAGVATGRWKMKTNGILLVEWFGAVGDGIADDGQRIQNCFLASKSLLEMRFSKKTYISSISIGTDTAVSLDYVDGLTIEGNGAKLIFNSPLANCNGIKIEGSNVTIRNLHISSTRLIDHTLDPSTLRTIYHYGITVGGKLLSPRSLGTSADLKENVIVENCTISNVNAPITIGLTSNGIIRNCKISDYTDTGILIDDCIKEIIVDNNIVDRGADDCIFARHYANSFYVNATTNYVGNIKITNNSLGYTFGKCFGVGGYSDVIFSGNSLDYSWAGSIDFENGASWSTRNIDNKNISIINNSILNAGSYYGASFWRTAPHPDLKSRSAIHNMYSSSRTPYPFSNVIINGNSIKGSEAYGIALKAIDYLNINNNSLIATKAGSQSAILLYDDQANTISNNTILGDGINWIYCYDLSTLSGTVTLAQTEISNNREAYSSLVMKITSFEYNSITYRPSSKNSAYYGTLRSDDFFGVSRLGIFSQGSGSNFQLYHQTGLPARLFNSSGTGLSLCVDNNGNFAGTCGIGIAGTAAERLQIGGNICGGTDNAYSCGTATYRWSVVYAGTGTINTSDITTKTFYEIEEAERLCAIELKGMMRKFKFNDAIDSKGEENARIHFGVGAQYVRDVFSKYGLDPFAYAMLCYDSWEEIAEVKDEEGNITQAYSPAGDRYGIRYDELICFIISAM